MKKRIAVVTTSAAIGNENGLNRMFYLAELLADNGYDVDFITSYIGTLGGDKYNNFFAWLEKKFGTRDFRSLNAEQGKIIVNALKGNK